MLRELIDAGKIKAGSKWKDVYPSFASDPRYINLLGNPGSNPLELFWDIVDSYDQKLDAKVAVVEREFKAYNERHANGMDIEPNGSGDGQESEPFVFDHETTEERFHSVLADARDSAIRGLSEDDLKEIFDYVRLPSLDKPWLVNLISYAHPAA